MAGGVTYERRTAERVLRGTVKLERKLIGQPRAPSEQYLSDTEIVHAEITGTAASPGTYTAKEQVFDGSVFQDLGAGRLWSASIPLLEMNLSDSVAVGTIVAPSLKGVTGGGFIWIFSQGGGLAAVPVKITAGSGSSYTIDVFADGSTNPATATGEALIVMQILGTETVPVDTFLLAVKIGATFYGQIPIWL